MVGGVDAGTPHHLKYYSSGELIRAGKDGGDFALTARLPDSCCVKARLQGTDEFLSKSRFKCKIQT